MAADTGTEVRGEAYGAPATRVSAPRLLVTLGSAGAIAGLLIVLVHEVTQPQIEAHREAALRRAVEEVLKGPERYDTLYVTGDGLTHDLPPGAEAKDLDKVYVGYRGEERLGYAIAAAEPGFQDVVRLLFGYDPGTGRLLGMKVLESKETPGLGDKIEKDPDFVGQFDGAQTPLISVKKGRGGGGAGEIDAITGATISSRAVVRIIDNALNRLDPFLNDRAGAPHPTTPGADPAAIPVAGTKGPSS